MTPLAKLLEAALFASPRPLSFETLAALDPEASPAAVSAELDALREHYDVDGHAFELVEQGGGWQLLTRPEYAEAIERAQVAVRPTRLSGAALETLAIVAYRQPIGRAEIEEIRGVSVGSVLKSLHERGLVDIVGRSEALGRPMLYGTTPAFLEQFGLRHLEELPRADELAIALRGAGGAIIAEPPEPPAPELPLGASDDGASALAADATTAAEPAVDAHREGEAGDSPYADADPVEDTVFAIDATADADGDGIDGERDAPEADETVGDPAAS